MIYLNFLGLLQNINYFYYNGYKIIPMTTLLNATNSIGTSFITSQSDLLNWNGTTDIIIMNNFTITDSYIPPIISTNITINGNQFTITIDGSTITSWDGFLSTNPELIININVNDLNVVFSQPLLLSGFILSNNQVYGTYNISIHRCSNNMIGYFSQYFLT